MGCPNGGGEDPTPTVTDFIINGTGTFTYDGNPKTVTVTAKEGKTSGTITVKYNGNTAAPSAVGIYAVTFNVTAATGWNAANGLSAGTLTIIPADPDNQTPAAEDFTISGTGTFTYDGNPKTVTVTAKEGKTSGAITVKYNGNTAAPSVAGIYTITFDTAAATGWNAANGLDAGTLWIYDTIIDNISNLATFLSGQTTNTKTTPYYIALNIDNETDLSTIRTTLRSVEGKYVYIDLSGSAVTEIPNFTFWGCTGLTGVIIPNSVTNIGNRAFANCTSLTGIIIPDSVTSIGNNAFRGCTSFTSIIIPNSVISIKQVAFYGCISLTSVNIPNSVTSIELAAFGGCTSLTSITADAGNSEYTAENGILYNKNKTVLHTYPAGITGAFTIPNSVTSKV